MLNIPEQGWNVEITHWFARAKQFFSTSKDVYGDLLGIDIDDTSVLSILLRNPLGKPRVSRADVVGLPAGAVTDDVIVNNAAVITAMKTMLQVARMQNQNTIIAMPGSRVVIKQIKLDAQLSDQNAEARAWQEARKTFPEIAKNLYLDFAQIEEPSIDKTRRFLLIIVIVKKEDVMPRVETLQHAALNVKIVDVDYYALERVYPLLAPQLPASHVDQYVAFIDFNPHSMVFVVMHNKKAVYVNRQQYMGDVLVSIVQHILKVDVAATKEKKSFLQSQVMPTLEMQSSQSEGLDEEKKSHVVMAIRRLFQSFYAENIGKIINQIVITGRCALISDLMQYAEKTLDIPMVIGNPLLQLKIGESLDSKRLLELGPAFALCCGLSMRGIPI